MLDLWRLRLLHEFSRRGSIAATAAALGYSPSAISQQLFALERQAGRALLDRTARSAQLIEAGWRLAEHAGRILTQVDAAEADLAVNADTPSGRMVISAFPTAALTLAAPAVQHLSRYPDLHIVVRQARPTDGLDRLRAGDVDLVDDWPWEATHRPDMLRFVELLRDPLVFVAPPDHPLAINQDDPLDPARFADQTWIAAPPDEPSRRALDAMFAILDPRPAITWEFQGLDTVVNLVAQGFGVAITPRLALGARHRRLTVRNLPAATVDRTVYAAVRRAHTKRPAIAAAIDAIRIAADDQTQQATCGCQEPHPGSSGGMLISM
jgi:DNA-binding transcriptional LysR family regulator